MADSSLSPLRHWIVAELKRMIPIPGTTIWSDSKQDAAYFTQLTGATQKSLEANWKIPGNRFTTCSSFLPIFATTIRRAGMLPLETVNKFGFKNTIALHGFALNSEVGWVPYSGSPAGAKPGDFFQLGHGGWTDHVGVILEIEDGQWSLVAGGAGGPSSKHDGVKRTALQPIPGGLMGWLDVDVYFQGWSDDPYA